MFKRHWWMLLVMAPVGMMAGLMLAAVVTYVMPKKYESFSVIEIKPRERQAIEIAPIPQSGGVTGTVFGTEFEKIKSRNSLSKVIDSLDLVNRWELDRETALRILKEIVQTENIRGTDLIQIRVRHTNKEEARDIAAGVARAYVEYRQEMESESMEKGINAFRKAVRQQEDKVEERRKILNSRGGPFLLDGSNLPDSLDVADAKRDFDAELGLLEQLKLNLVREEIIQSLPNETVVVHDDPVIADSPISPNVTFNFVAGTFGGGLLSTFLALPLMWFISRRKSGSSGGF